MDTKDEKAGEPTETDLESAKRVVAGCQHVTAAFVGDVGACARCIASGIAALRADRRNLRHALERSQKGIAGLKEILGKIEAWTHVYGADLIPSRVDSYGEGVRSAKDQVRTALAGGAEASTETPHVHSPEWEIKTNRHRSIDGSPWGWIAVDGISSGLSWSGLDGQDLAESAVHAVNAHDALVAALKAVVDAFHSGGDSENARALMEAEAALAKAGGAK